MLLRFRTDNSRSFRREAELSLVMSSLRGPDIVQLPIPQMSDSKALPCAVIYGANASGKSNFLKAFAFFRSVILQSHNRGSPKGGVPRIPFRLTSDLSVDSSFEADFVSENVRFTYGFSCNDDDFTGEWLYSFPEGKRRILFERAGQNVEFGSKFLGPKKAIVEFMRSNSLFVSTATQNDHPELSKIVDFFRNCISHTQMSVSEHSVLRTFNKGEIDQRIISFLRFVGTGVEDFKTQDVEAPDEIRGLQADIDTLLRKRFGSEMNAQAHIETQSVSIELGHKGDGGDLYFFELDDESTGTRRLLVLMSAVFRALDNGTPVFVDELDASLHTLACEEIIKLFQSPITNPKGAQLIATTHDTNLLSSAHLRRDQVWFCERCPDGSSEIYSLAEIKSRHDDNFERGYLEGRYGGIPYAGNSELLFG